LNRREQAVLEHAIAGRSSKWIALELTLSEPTVARTLRSALRRLGVADATALPGVRAAPFKWLNDPNAGVALAVARIAMKQVTGLSRAEQSVLRRFLDGASIAAIARERGTSSWTVSHQVGSIYRKLRVSSRRELLAWLR
jgi:DNA-binding CsgD family transcriptional regulator